MQIKSDDYNTLRDKGVSLSKLGREEETIGLYDKALQIKSDDYNTLRGMGVSLSKSGRQEEAIDLFDRALQIKPDDSLTLRNKGVTYFHLGKYESALECLREAVRIDLKNKDITEAYSYVIGYLKRDVAEQESVLDDRQADGIVTLRGMVQKIRDEMKDSVNLFLAQMEEREVKRSEFLSRNSLLNPSRSLLLLLRKWNSFTPIIPSKEDERYVGGGYFIYHRGCGNVIDPGYNFIENFCRAGCRITDIDNVILSHAHNDHTNDFESLLSLIYQYNRKNKIIKSSKEYKKINIYMNIGSFKKFSGLMDLRSSEYIDCIYTLSERSKYKLGEGVTVQALRAYHDELISKKYAVGLKFSIGNGKDAKTILITSDTGLFPHKKGGLADEDVADVSKQEIWETYRLSSKPVHLLIVHIGSIREDEFKASIDAQNEKVFYPNHLGIMGTIRVISKIKPRLAIVSEFGEELIDFQEDLIKSIEKVVNACFAPEDCPKFLPGDLPLIYSIEDEKIYCVLSKQLVPASHITYTLPDKKTLYYYDARISDPSRLTKMSAEANSFEINRKNKEGLYFKS